MRDIDIGWWRVRVFVLHVRCSDGVDRCQDIGFCDCCQVRYRLQIANFEFQLRDLMRVGRNERFQFISPERESLNG